MPHGSVTRVATVRTRCRIQGWLRCRQRKCWHVGFVVGLRAVCVFWDELLCFSNLGKRDWSKFWSRRFQFWMRLRRKERRKTRAEIFGDLEVWQEKYVREGAAGRGQLVLRESTRRPTLQHRLLFFISLVLFFLFAGPWKKEVILFSETWTLLKTFRRTDQVHVWSRPPSWEGSPTSNTGLSVETPTWTNTKKHLCVNCRPLRQLWCVNCRPWR